LFLVGGGLRESRCQYAFFSVLFLPSSESELVIVSLSENFPLPEIQLGCVFGVPLGLMVHPSMAVPTHRLATSSDDGVGTWRLILHKFGPLPARMVRLQLATWIHPFILYRFRKRPPELVSPRQSRLLP
jgi:hypothetical protein